jgi:mannosyltransferase
MMAFVLILSFLLRLIGINQSLWLDEAISANMAQLPINKIVTNFSIGDFHPPLHYWFLNIWIKIFGNGVVIMRLSSVIFSLITIWLVYLIGKEIKDKKLGFWAALLVAVNPLLIYYSQELRMYSMAVMLLTGAVYFWIRVGKKPNRKNMLGFNLMTFLAFVTFYGSVFLIGAMILYLLVNKKVKQACLSGLGLLLAILVVSPLLLTQLKNSGEMLGQVVNWSLVLGKVNLKNLILIPLKFSIGRISWYPKIFYYLIGGVWTLIVFGLALKQIIKNKILGFLLIVPVIFGIIFSLKSPLIQYFRFLYLIPILGLLLADIKNYKIKIFLIGGFLIFSLMYLLNPKMYREDWKSVAIDLKDNQKIYMIATFDDPIKFYKKNIQIGDIKTNKPTEDEVVLIPYGEAIHGIETTKKMTEWGYKLAQTKNYREIVVETWKKQFDLHQKIFW